MFAVRKPSAADSRVELQTLPVPEPAAGEVRIRVTGAGICGTDQHILDGDYASRPPVTLGHEVAGIVDAVGHGVDPAWLGALVAPETAFSTCGVCQYCRGGRPMLCAVRVSIGSGIDGGFAGAMVVPARLVHRLPIWLDDRAAALMEPLACVCNSVLDPPRVQLGETVLVSGAGPVGLLAAQVARAAGAIVTVTGVAVDAERLALAAGMGFATRNIEDPADAADIDRMAASRAIDVALECAGTGPAVATALRVLRPGGRLVQMGLLGGPVPVPFGEIVTRELTVTAGFGSSPTSWRRAVHLVEERAVDLVPLVSRVYALRDHAAAFASFARREGLKTLFDPRLA